MHMPRSPSPVVSHAFAIAHVRLMPSRKTNLSAFRTSAGALSMLSLWTTTIHFSEISSAAYALTTPGFIHTLLAMHTGSFPDRWLRSLGGICVMFLHAPTG